MDSNQIEQSQRLKKLIKALGINQTLFAKSLGMTQPNISRMISGEGKVSAEVLNRITITYKNINLHWLITGDGDMFLETAQEKDSQVNEPSIAIQKGQGRLEELEARVDRLEDAMRRLTKDF